MGSTVLQALVPDIAGLVRSFSKQQLSFFCRVLALVVFEPEVNPGPNKLNPEPWPYPTL